jgi:outer membrane protein OmpA-like peptidoglycan-associated protein
MRAQRSLALVAAAAIAGTVSLAAQKYRDPDSPEVAAAAKAALAHARVLNVTGVTRNIVGVSSGVNGLLTDLGAKVVGRQVHIALSADVLFDFDAFTLRPAAAATLHKVAGVIQAYPGAPVLIEGYTDAKGSDAYNLTLSRRRAEAVKQWLAANAGVDASRMRTKGWGAAHPVAPNTTLDGRDDPAGRQQNRRVEITVTRVR